MMNNHIANINNSEIKKVYTYSDKCLEYILKQTNIEPFEKFNPRNRKSVIIYER